MEIKIRSRKDITIIDLEGTEIDHKNTSYLSEKILALINEESIQNIALNLEKISWLTSSGIGALLNIRKTINKAEATGITPAASPSGAVYFNEARLVLECKKIYFQDLQPQHFLAPDIEKNYPAKDYHRMYIGEIVRCLVKK